jgi:hypothetical protein
MTNYQITIGYKAIITVNVKADNEEDAKKKAIEQMRKSSSKMHSNSVQIQDDNYKADGILNMDETWNMYDK